MAEDTDISRILRIEMRGSDSFDEGQNTDQDQRTFRSRQQKNKGEMWTDDLTEQLILIRVEMDDDFEKPIQRRKLWAKIASCLQEKGYAVTGDECDTKWRNLLITFRKNKEKVAKSGRSSVTWKYFALIDEGVGFKVDIASPASPPTDTLNLDPCNVECPQTFADQLSYSFNPRREPSPSTSSASSPPSGKETRKVLKRVAEDEPPAWFASYVETTRRENQTIEEKLEKRWKEYIRMEEKKVTAIYALIDVLKKK